jgi:hypothetical protein
MQDEPLPQKELGRRSEHREPVDQYHSVELTVSPNRIIYQFRIWNISQKGMCILLKEDSAAFDHIHVGDIIEMKYYPTESARPTESFKTKIQHITKEDTGRFKGHYLVGLLILNKQGLMETDPSDQE